METTQYWQF